MITVKLVAPFQAQKLSQSFYFKKDLFISLLLRELVVIRTLSE